MWILKPVKAFFGWPATMAYIFAGPARSAASNRRHWTKKMRTYCLIKADCREGLGFSGE